MLWADRPQAAIDLIRQAFSLPYLFYVFLKTYTPDSA